MEDKKYTDHEVAEIIEDEGIGYAVLHYMNSTYCKNPETAELWDQAEIALKNLADHLGCECS